MVNNLTKAFQRINLIKHDDTSLNAQTWFKIQPVARYKVGRHTLTITQPSSTFWVYLLGLLTCYVGYIYWHQADGEMSRQLWSIGLWLWGVGALLAGTSYQAFGYQLKCQGRDHCVWSNWWEISYMILQQLSINFLLAAVAYSSTHGGFRTGLIVAAISLSIVYTGMTLFVAFKPYRKWLTFEWMSFISKPFVIFMLLLNGWRFISTGLASERSQLAIWCGLLMCMLAYWLYGKSGLTQKRWHSQKKWLSENDVLHVTLIVWVIYIASISNQITDY